MNFENFFNEYRKHFGKIKKQSVVENIEIIVKAMEKYKLELYEKAYIMATVHHETGTSYEPIIENMNYTSAKRIRQVWPSRFPLIAGAQPYVRNPYKLAEKVYNNRKELGNNKPGDGWLYRGRGYSQVTGKINAERFSKFLNVDFVNQPELLSNPQYAAEILIMGSKNGLFTGKKLSDYKGDYINMRRVINADVKLNGAKIATYARKFENIFKALVP